MPHGIFRCSKQLRHAQRKSPTKTKPVSQKEVTWKCFSDFSLDRPSYLFWGDQGMQSGSLAQCHWPCPWSWEEDMANTLVCLSRALAQQRSTVSFWHKRLPFHTSTLFYLSNSCWLFKMQFTYYLGYKVTQVPPRRLLITYFHYM